MRKPLGLASVVAAAFLLLHLPFLPPSLEDIDSINFALGVREFDVARHQPHPPGYPLFILAAKGVSAIVSNEAHALGLLGIVSGTLAVFALVHLFRRFGREPQSGSSALLATMLTATAPLYWVTAARPLSDMLGLASVVGVQALTLAATTGTRLAVAAFVAGLAAGIRSQVMWLTVPLVVLVAARRPREYRLEDAIVAIGALVVGGLVWFVPLVWLSGGPSAYWRALSEQGAQDFTGVTMLWTTHTPRQMVRAFGDTFVALWGTPALSGIILALALCGALRLLKQSRASVVALVVAFGPYLIFHLLFQETVTTRYALPMVVPLAFLAVRGAAALPERVATVVVGGLVLSGLVLGAANLQAFAREEAPAFRLLKDMRTAAPTLGAPPVLATVYSALRAVTWVRTEEPSWFQPLPSAPKREWLEIVHYLNAGGRASIWAIADPLRTDLALIDHQAPRATYRWPLTHPILLGGVRPNGLDWYVIQSPGWYLGEGWALTPETAGVAETGGRGRGRAPSEGWVLRRTGAVTLMIGGRNFSRDGSSAAVTVSVDGRVIDDRSVAPGFFLYMVSADLAGAGDYGALTVATRGEVAIEQFDAQPSERAVLGYGQGWHEREYDPATGRLWRWMSERGELPVRGAAGQALALTLEGATETFSKPSRVTVRAGDLVLAQQEVGEAFSMSVEIPPDTDERDVERVITIETDQTYVPAERSSRTADRRRLGLKMFTARVAIRP